MPINCCLEKEMAPNPTKRSRSSRDACCEADAADQYYIRDTGNLQVSKILMK